MTQPNARPDPKEIAGRYQVLQKLGSGAFGTVYKARDNVLGRLVAIKTIRLDGMAASAASLEELLARFRREAQVSAQLKHPNIVTIYDIGQADGISYLAMEFVDGLPLDKIIAGAGKLPLERAAAIAAQIADALDYAHRNNVVHRDVKPANVMIEAGDRVKVTDFGIAKAIDSSEHLTVTGSLLGTPSYMSPEQARGGQIDGRSDIFSVGCILYEMLTGKKAFVGDTITALIFKIITEEPPSLKRIDPAIPEPMVRIIGRALSKTPETRYATAREMAGELLKLSSPAAVSTLRQGEAPTVVLPSADSTAVARRPPGPSTHVSSPTHASARYRVAPAPPPPRARQNTVAIILIVGAFFACLAVVVVGAAWWVLSRGRQSGHETAAAVQTESTPLPSAAPAPFPDADATAATPEPTLEWAGEGLESPLEGVDARPAVEADAAPVPEPHARPATPPLAIPSTPRPSTPPSTSSAGPSARIEQGGDADQPEGRAAGPVVARSRSERAAIKTLSTFVSAQRRFRASRGRYGTPAELRTSQSLDIMRADSDSFMSRGYRFRVRLDGDGFTVTATAMRSGHRAFVTDEGGLVRVSD